MKLIRTSGVYEELIETPYGLDCCCCLGGPWLHLALIVLVNVLLVYYVDCFRPHPGHVAITAKLVEKRL
jgi:hypothetical protein